jgi:hypothetical protein
MAKRKHSGGSLDRQIAAARKKLAHINSKKRAAKAAKRKAATLQKLKNKLKAATARHK